MTFQIDAQSPAEAIIVMSRTFDAPREKVWAALTTPEHAKRWFGGVGFVNPVCEMDVRPGGIWHHVMRTPDGMEFAMDMIYVEVVRPERLVWHNVNYGKDLPGPPLSHNTVTLTDLGDRTGWQMEARFVSFADRDAAMAIGFGDTLRQGCERMNEVVRAL